MPLPLSVFHLIVHHGNDAVLVTEAEPLHEPGPAIIYANPAMCELSGYPLDELLGQSPRMLQGPLTDPATLVLLGVALRAGRETKVELLNYQRSGTPYWAEIHILPLSDETGSIRYFASIQRDITEKRTRQESLYRLAVADDMTNLFNRQMFFDVGAKCMLLTYRQNTPLAVAVLELVDFRRLQESYGQLVGHMILRLVSQALLAAIRDSDIAGRLDNNEFGLLLPEASPDTAQIVLDRIKQQLAQSWREAGLPSGVRLSLRCGVASAGDADENLEQVLQRARASLQQLAEASS
ncbi:diguanylate cyclase domain-containing protein [Chromobacterium sp. IIBBL 290-4]|uniref:diguanylate cyclase domain-containing protein n=1 Tax=Chromobacterium sp. IIBBL 290-4 TaxID=2953890 RepID=UPI0020B8C06D|nr:diguanylate cyclase [Chromobacterium sp. IIBBL 290-4]UTH76063.1 diguanylate cyclase [Chromobacterium sp. IIBBL 290-4]